MTGAPSAGAEKAKHDAMRVRGVILNHYAAVEFAVDEMLYRCRRTVEYRPLAPRKLPRAVEDKLAILSEVLTAPGPLKAHSSRLIHAIGLLNHFTAIRHLAAHGRLTLDMDAPDGPVMVLEKFSAKPFGMDSLRMTRADIRNVTAQLSGYALATIREIGEASEAAGLPTLTEPDDPLYPDSEP